MTGGADVQVVDVWRTFAMPGGSEIPVLKGVNLSVLAGETLAITGPSGSGKTTLLQLLGAMDTADSGRIAINGRDLNALNDAERTHFRNREIGFVFQKHHLLPQLTARENVLVPAWAGKVDGEIQARAVTLLERVGLGARMDHFPGQLSGGERQRVALARAILLQPCLILADEPTGALDAATAEKLMDLLVEINQEYGATLVVVTHSAACARRLNRSVELRNGVIVG
jgi:ABC-type lipoprotein export system ATPase subunit